MEVFVNVEYRGAATMFERSAGVPASNRMLNRVKTVANKVTALDWHQSILPKHFTSEQVKYANQSRKAPYKRIKKALAQGPVKLNGRTITERVEKGGRIDNVRGGAFEQQAKASPVIRSTKVRAVLKMIVPFYAALKRRDQPDKGKEITKVTSDENQKLRRTWFRTFVRGLRENRDVIRKKLN